jgi:ABC-2 type transport system permease protein
MATNLEFQRAGGSGVLRGFGNLYRKEHRAWWGTRRWWLNALLWTVLLCGLTAIMLFVPNEEVAEASAADIAQAGGELAYTIAVGMNVFFQFGVSVLGIGTIVLAQDLIVGERHSGVAEWLLSKPVSRRAYILAKLAAGVVGVLVLLVGLPSTVTYGIVSLRWGSPYPLGPFAASVGITAVHTLFYLTLTLMLGTFFTARAPILGISLGSLLGGGILGNLINPLTYVTPWTLAEFAWLTSTRQAAASETGVAALIATGLWCVVFTLVALARFEKTEY